MLEVNFEIQSICPLKMDKWVEGQQPKTDLEYMKQAEKKAYRNDKNEIVIPAEAIKAVIRNAGSELMGRKGKSIRQTIRSSLFPKEDLPLGTKKYDLIAKDIVTRGKGEKVTRVPTYRPLIKQWKTHGTIQVVSGELSADFVKQCLEVGGLKYGLLSHRPEFGRFVVTKWEVKKDDKKKKQSKRS